MPRYEYPSMFFSRIPVIHGYWPGLVRYSKPECWLPSCLGAATSHPLRHIIYASDEFRRFGFVLLSGGSVGCVDGLGGDPCTEWRSHFVLVDAQLIDPRGDGSALVGRHDGDCARSLLCIVEIEIIQIWEEHYLRRGNTHSRRTLCSDSSAMAKAGLKALLKNHKGVDHKLERQKKQQKAAEKRKRATHGDGFDEVALEKAIAAAGNGTDALIESSEESDAEDGADLEREELAANGAQAAEKRNGQSGGWETDESDDAEEEEEADGGVDLEALEDDSDESDSDEAQDLTTNDLEDDEDIPLSDIESLASDEKGDVIPHQRLTINNTAALQRSLKSFALSSSLPFSAVQAVTSVEPITVENIEDDLKRETAFYQQALDAVREARNKLQKEGVPFSRPADYFAEMVKSEEQMGKVRQKMVDEAARKKASADARRQRDLKKFGKAVQVAKLQERSIAKRDTLDKINVLKRKRQGAELEATEESMFDVALEDAAVTDKKDRAARKAGKGGPNKRAKKDEKFGFGGKKRFAKSNDARSTSDTKGYSVKKMKGDRPGGGKPGGGAKQRPGKSRRTKF
nr:rrna-processing protein ebp2 [Quercus suber]